MKNYNAILSDDPEEIAEDSNANRAKKNRSKAEKLKSFGETKGCRQILADGGKIKFYVKPNQDIESRLEHYRVMYPDAKIVK